MKRKEALKKARSMGMRQGNGCADWYFDRTEPSRDDAQKVLKGIMDCDPAIMDTFVSGGLSGEFAGDPTPQSLYEVLELTDRQVEQYGDLVCDAYEEGFNSAYESSVEQQCRELLRRNVIFHLEYELEEQDENKLLIDLEEVLGKANCSLVHSSVSEEGEVIA